MIISVLTTIVAAMDANGDSFHFDYGKKGYQNLIEDEKLFPGVLYDTDSPFELQIAQSGYIGEVYKPRLLFLYKSELDWKPVQHDTDAIIPAIAALRQFITRCQNADDLIDSINIIGDVTQHINLLDVNASGVIAQFEIKLKITASECVT